MYDMHEGSGPCSSSEVMLSTMHFKAGMDFKMSRCVCVSVCVCVCVCVCVSAVIKLRILSFVLSE